MTRALVDTNVLLDYLEVRAPFEVEATAVWQAQVDGKFDGFIAAISVTTIYYIARRSKGQAAAFQIVKDLLTIWHISPVDEAVLNEAMALPFRDFEDAVQNACAAAIQADVIVPVTDRFILFGAHAYLLYSPNHRNMSIVNYFAYNVKYGSE